MDIFPCARKGPCVSLTSAEKEVRFGVGITGRRCGCGHGRPDVIIIMLMLVYVNTRHINGSMLTDSSRQSKRLMRLVTFVVSKCSELDGAQTLQGHEIGLEC